MSFHPNQLRKEHVLKGVEKIDKENPSLNPSTRWDVVIDGKHYPPKEVMRFARQTFDGIDSWRYGGGPPTNKYLQRMGFEIFDKGNKTGPLPELITKYKKYLDREGLEDEVYKWLLVEKYQGRPDTEAQNFEEEINSLRFENLIYHNAITAMRHLSKQTTAPYRDLFKMLFDESKDLVERIRKFDEESKKLFNSLFPEDNLSHHQDERTISAFLTFKYPESYTFYKDSYYKKFCELLGVKPRFKGEKYAHYLELIKDFVEDYISQDKELLAKVSNLLPEDAYPDEQHLILAQDVLYCVLEKNLENMRNGEVTEEIDDQDTPERTETDLNQILYGPPGTGKTYYSKELAVRLANPQFSVEDLPVEEGREKINEEYRRLYDVGQITFTTFHQSFSYEDFVEGIKPVSPVKDGDQISYTVEDGIFKLICSAAGNPNFKQFEDAYNSLIKDLGTSQEVVKIETPTGKLFGIALNSRNNLTLHTGENFTEQGTITKDFLLKEINGENDYFSWRGYYQGVIDHLKKKYGYKDSSKSTENFVLIIDEINRGNVSAIFGELITLLEQDKRLGNDEEITVKLPYSKVPFGIPNNLHIIGTMNTADRSVEALDTALRRRFVFEEIMPQPELLRKIDFDGFNLEELLRTINERIETLLDRDHTIGHSYFIKINSGDTAALQEAFENKIIPLLQEYFYHDYEKIALILGEGFIERKDAKLKFAKFSKIDIPEVLPSYHLKEVEDIETAIRILLNREDEAGE